MREGRREGGEEEPVDAEDEQAEQQDVEAGALAEDQHGEPGDEAGPQQRGAHQDPLPSPAIQQHTGERPDDGVRQEQHRERGRDLTGRGLPLGGEQDVGGQAGLQSAVRGLGEQPGAEEQPEASAAQDQAEVGCRGHLPTVRAPRHRSGGTRRG